MALFGRYILSLVVFAFLLGYPFAASTLAQDGPSIVESDEEIPHIVDDEEVPHIVDDEEAEEGVPYIVEDEEDAESSSSVASASSKNGGSSLLQVAVEFLSANWQLVAGLLAAVLLIPIALRMLFRRKDPMAKYAASSMAQPSQPSSEVLLPEARPADPLAIDSEAAFTHDGFVAPLASDVPASASNVVTEYGGSDVPPGAPGYPSISLPAEPVTVVREGAELDGLDLADEDAVELVGRDEEIEAEVLDDAALVEEVAAPQPDMDGTFEVANSPSSSSDSSSDKIENDADTDIDAFQAANASDPFEIEDEHETIADSIEATNDETVDAVEDVEEEQTIEEPVAEGSDEEPAEEPVAEEPQIEEAVEPETGAEAEVSDVDEEIEAAQALTKEFSDDVAADLDEALPLDPPAMPVVPVAAPVTNALENGAGALLAAGAGAAAVAAKFTSAPAAAVEPDSEAAMVAEIRIEAIQKALGVEQQRTAKLDAEHRQLRDLVTQLESRLASSSSRSATTTAPVVQFTDTASTGDGDMLVTLQDQNRELQNQLQESQAQQQANQLQLKTLESSVKSLDARLNMVNAERDNLARMLYDAKRQMSQNAMEASPKPR